MKVGVPPKLAFVFALATACHGQVTGQPADLGSLTPAEQSRRAREEYSRLYEDQARDPWQMPDKVVKALGLKPSDTVTTVGDGDAYLSRRIAQYAKEVLVVDDEQKKLLRAQKEKPGNLMTILSTPANPAVQSGAADVIVLYNHLGRIADRPAYYLELAKGLKANGRLVVIDFYKKLPPGLPPTLQITANVITGEMKNSGFRLTSTLDFLPFQYFLTFQR